MAVNTNFYYISTYYKQFTFAPICTYSKTVQELKSTGFYQFMTQSQLVNYK